MLCLLLLIDLPLLCVGFLLLNSREDIVGFKVFRVVLADSTIFHLLEFLDDISEGECVVYLRCGWSECDSGSGLQDLLDKSPVVVDA